MLFEIQVGGKKQTAPNTVFTPIPSAALGFTVAEPLMVAELEFSAVFSSLAAGDSGVMRLTLYLNGEDLSTQPEGIVGQQISMDWVHPMICHRRLTLPKGEYSVAAYWKYTGLPAPGPPEGQLNAQDHPAYLSVMLHSHTQPLGQGVNSKTQRIY